MASHRCYFVKTQSGRVLVRNCHFLRKQTPISIGAPGGDNQMQESPEQLLELNQDAQQERSKHHSDSLKTPHGY